MIVPPYRELRVILIGGSSHTGKSTLAQALAQRLGWRYRTTDKLARHPGRPWPTAEFVPPEHVAEHYLTLSVDELMADVLKHYRTKVWPLVLDIVSAHATDLSADRLVLEGSALLPDLVATVPFDNVSALWLTASPGLFERRIYASSQYATKSKRDKVMIDSFLARTRRYDEEMVAAVKQLGLPVLDIESAANLDALLALCLAALGLRFVDLPKASDGPILAGS